MEEPASLLFIVLPFTLKENLLSWSSDTTVPSPSLLVSYLIGPFTENSEQAIAYCQADPAAMNSTWNIGLDTSQTLLL